MTTRMAAYTTIELDRIARDPGDGKRIEVDLDPGTVRLGADEYAFEPTPAKVRLDVSRTATGHALKLAFAGELAGTCMRCLGPARVPVEVEAREVDQPRTDDEELRSPYVTDGELDLSGWAHDALALSMPQQLLCRPDCAGLCPVCGESLNDAAPGA